MEIQLHVTYHAFGLIEDGVDWPIEVPFARNGLISPFLGGVLLHTGIHSGHVRVNAVSYSSVPPEINRSLDWETIAEVTTRIVFGRLRVRSYDEDPGLSALSVAGPGLYRIRAYSIGRDVEVDGVNSTTESYRVEVWPTAEEDSIVYRTNDDYGRQVLQFVIDDAGNEPSGKVVDGAALDEWV
ncbi:hypothetical protein ACTOB_003725 [Actinoplanes oblitus]|uniref:Uncharacterized protein n=1 Tax=Actinoplanes oblitus TaxID=3040509 RepID=A0ABY8WTB8_9ACTN|nr:hypothetical protein [Actinoplanes oblitus]WIN00048.1 hypothetical protein ACTOB_003725 [Actinoplanes oblitus]